MKTFQGIAASSGLAIGEAMVIDNGKCRINRRFISPSEVEAEVNRFRVALEAAQKQIALNRDSVIQELGKEYGQIFEAHLQILSDPRLQKELEENIRNNCYSAEYSTNVTFERYVALLRKVQENQFTERANDIRDIELRLLRELMGIRKEELVSLDRPVIILATNLTPSETTSLDREKVLGFATESGGLGSHTSIVASALQIPAVLGIGTFLDQVDDGDIVILDGENGLFILDPDVETIQKYENLIAKNRHIEVQLSSLADQQARTKDGTVISIYGNIEFPYEAKICLESGADGIGLYRTEFLYLAASPDEFPDEDAHFEAYKMVLEDMQGKPVTIRTFDLGADKLPEGFSFSRDPERNPFMGLRSIRLSLKNTQMFRSQLRAILRASAYGKIRIMFPLVSTIHEFRQAKMIFTDTCEELYERGIPFDPKIPLGIMVEVPSTVIMLGTFVRDVDFFSIGTNDLIQYTLAVDRSNKEVGALYNSEDPALIRLVRQAIKVADMYDKPISLCGQMGSNTQNTMLLLGLGLRNFSVSPGSILKIKKICQNVTIEECKEIAQKASMMERVIEIRGFLRRKTRELFDKDLDD